MKKLIQTLSITAILFLTSGCGGSVDRSDYDKDKPIPSLIKQPKKEQIEPKSKDCSKFLKKSIDTIEILDSSLECPPNVDLYHAEVKPTYYEYMYDDEYKANVIYFKSNGLKNAIHIQGYDTNKTYEWAEYPNYQNKFNISWNAKFSNDFIIYVVIKFQDKNETIQKDLVYTPSDVGYPYYTKEHLHISLGEKAKDGEWHHYERNILDDLHIYYPDAKIIYKENYYKSDINYLNGFALRGTGSITDIMLKK